MISVIYIIDKYIKNSNNIAAKYYATALFIKLVKFTRPMIMGSVVEAV